MKHARIVLVVLAGLLLISMPARAGLFGGKEKEEPAPTGPRLLKQYHLHIPDKITENEFLDLFTQKRELNEDLIVLFRLNEEKHRQYADLQRVLADEFSVMPENRYQFDKDTFTIHELVPEPRTLDVQDEPLDPAATPLQTGPMTYTRRTARKLDDEAAGKAFLDLLRQKKLVHNELTVLNALAVQKKMALKRVNDQLLSKFSLKPDGVYNYDPEEMALYELVPAGKK